ncbi:hypothetical protein [Sphingobium nicotianae]|nr:hypothetical protein [Sphingobium nicotianae]
MPKTIAIDELPLLDDEAALFNAAVDMASLQGGETYVIIAIITG